MSDENKKPEEEQVSMTTHTEAAPATDTPATAEDPDKAAKVKAAEEARAARAAARAAKAAEGEGAVAGDGGGEEAPPKEPSPNQPKLDRLVAIITEHIGDGAVLEAYINERDRHLPVIVIDNARWPEIAMLMRDHAELKLHYLRNVSGVDYETHLEVDYYMINLSERQEYCVKVRADRDNAVVASATPTWASGNWPEREIYDLLGVTFTDHPDLRRIMMPDDWVGHPLRKDYEPIDPEV